MRGLAQHRLIAARACPWANRSIIDRRLLGLEDALSIGLPALATLAGVFALLVYSTAVVSIPMILDRDTDAISAAITSIRVVFANPITLFWWGFLITLLIAVALATWGAGFVVIGPLLGHASWHAYRGAVRWQEPAGTPAD